MPVHLCGSSDRSTCGLGEQDAGGQGARWLHGASAGLEWDRGPQPPQSLVSGNTGPYCRSGRPTAPHAPAPDPQQYLPPGRWRGCLTPWPLVLPWPGGLCRTATGDHGGTLGLFSAVGVLTTQGLCLPLPPCPRQCPAEGSRASGLESVSWDESGAMEGPDCGELPLVGSRGHTWVHMQLMPMGSTSGTQRQPEGGPGDLSRGGVQGTDMPGEGRWLSMAGTREVAEHWCHDRAGA